MWTLLMTTPKKDIIRKIEWCKEEKRKDDEKKDRKL
jgi:hypothetical protein